MFSAHRTAAASPGGSFAQALAAAITKLGTVQLYRSQHGHGLFQDMYAPSTLGSFLRAFRFGHGGRRSGETSTMLPSDCCLIEFMFDNRTNTDLVGRKVTQRLSAPTARITSIPGGATVAGRDCCG